MSESQKQIQKLTATIAAMHDRRAAVEQQLERIEAVAAHGDAFSAELESLREKRRGAAAQALIEARDANLREFDSAIAKLEKTSAEARSAADAAPVAIAQLNDQLAEIDDQLADFVSTQRTATRAWLDEQYAHAETQAAEAIRTLGATLCQCAALEALRTESFPGAPVYANAIQVLNRLRMSGALTAPFAASFHANDGNLGSAALSDSEWQLADWIAPAKPGELLPEFELKNKIADELRAIGVDPDSRAAAIPTVFRTTDARSLASAVVTITELRNDAEYRRDPVGRGSSGVTVSVAQTSVGR